MKAAQRNLRALRRAGLLLAPVLGLLAVQAGPPAWWGDRGVTTELDAADYAAVNQGQVKWMATRAEEELDAMLLGLGGAGTNIEDLTTSFSFTNNYLAVNLGQLKGVSQVFYDRLWALSSSEPYLTNAFPAGMTAPYPWPTNTTGDADYAMGNIGQAKYLFSFDLDRDADGMPGWWEDGYGLDPSDADDAEQDGDGDYLNNLAEYQQQTDPSAFNDADGDGLPDGLDAYPTNYDTSAVVFVLTYPTNGMTIP